MTFRKQYEQKRVKPIRWNVVLYSIALSEVVTMLVSLFIGKFIPILFVMGVVVPLVVAPAMMYHSFKLRARLIEQVLESEERLRDALAEKEVLMQEVHHRVKNNMAIITSFLRLQSKYTDDPGAKQILQECQHRVRSMALVHDELKLENDRMRMDIKGYIRTLLDGLLAACSVPKGDLQYSMDIEEVPLGIKTTMNCGLIINELVTNSLKYAFKGIDAPRIHVGLRSETGGDVVLTVSDNGCGIPADVDINSGKTLGLQIVHSLVGQLDGSLNIDTTEGTAFNIRFRGAEE